MTRRYQGHPWGVKCDAHVTGSVTLRVAMTPTKPMSLLARAGCRARNGIPTTFPIWSRTLSGPDTPRSYSQAAGVSRDRLSFEPSSLLVVGSG